MNPIEFTEPSPRHCERRHGPYSSILSRGAGNTLESALVPVELAAGTEMVFIAEYPNPDSPGQRVGVADWTDLAATTDYRANSNANGTGTNRTSSLTVTETKAGNTLRIEVENGHSGTVYLTRLQARGTPLIEGSTTSIPIKDDDSILKYKKRDYQVPSQFISTLADAQSYGGFLVRVLKDPQTRAKVTFEGSRYEEYADSVDLSQRVTLRRRGVSAEMFVEGVDDQLSEGGRHSVGLLLSPADVFGDVIVLGIGPGLGTGILAR